jgi:heat shock protein HslJ
MILGLILAIGTAGMTMSADLTGGDWHPTFLSASELPAGGDIVVQFTPDGKISGYGGCNRFFGAYTVSDNHIEIGPVASTRKGCPGVIEIETAFFATLRAAQSFTQEGDTLVLYDAAGGKLVQFVRD